MATDYFHNYQAFLDVNGTPPSPLGTPLPNRATSWKKACREPSVSAEALGEQRDVSPVSPLSPLDSRRMTPTLHAALVSEILGLRRELEAKGAFIDNLESDLQAAKSENDMITHRLVAAAKNTRSTERVAEQAEKHLYDVTNGLSKERDQALSVSRDARQKLEALTRKSRRQEDDLVRWQKDWDNERQKWDNERRQLETRVHITENLSLIHI